MLSYTGDISDEKLINTNSKEYSLPKSFIGDIDPKLVYGPPGIRRLKFDILMESKMWATCTLTLELKRSMKAIVNKKPDLKMKKNFKI